MKNIHKVYICSLDGHKICDCLTFPTRGATPSFQSKADLSLFDMVKILEQCPKQ